MSEVIGWVLEVRKDGKEDAVASMTVLFETIRIFARIL